MSKNGNDLPPAVVQSITDWRRHGDHVWIVVATCPEGRIVGHGGGDSDGPPILGARVSHCDRRPLTRQHPSPCTHGDYALTEDLTDYREGDQTPCQTATTPPSTRAG